MNGLTTTLTVLGSGLIASMWGMNHLNRVNPASIFYFGMNALGFVLLFIAALMIDADLWAINNWPMQIILLFISTWAMKLFFRKR